MTVITKFPMITYSLLCLLLLYRISVEILQFMSSLFTQMGTFPAWFDAATMVFPTIISLYNSSVFGLIAIAVILDKTSLQRLNIDRFFILIFLYAGLVTFLGPIAHYKWLAGITWVLFLGYVFLSSSAIASSTMDPNVGRISLIAIGVFVVFFLAVENFLNLPKIAQNINIFFLSTIPNVVYEEAIFRGMLWKLLKNLQLSEPNIVLSQAFLFWLAHIRYLISNHSIFGYLFLCLACF